MPVMAGRGGRVRLVDLLLVAGQSNAVGQVHASDLPVHLQASDSGVKIWNGSAFVTLVNGTNNNLLSDTPSDGWGPEAEFAYQYRQVFPGRTIYVCKSAWNGTSLAAEWNPSGGTRFSGMETQAAACRSALSAIPSLRTGVLWMQGETDAEDNTDANNYGTNLAAFLTAVNSRWDTVQATTPVIIGRMSNSTFFTFRAAVRSAQSAAAAANTKVVDTDSYTLQGDNIHYNAAGIASLGLDMFTSWSAI